MPPDISNSGQESIRGFLQRFLPKTLRPKSERYGDGWQQETVAPGFLRDYPTLFPQQQGPSFITPTQRAVNLFTFPFGGTPNPPTDPPPTDDPPGSGSGPPTVDPDPDPPGSGSGGDSGSGSGSGFACPYYFKAESCAYGTGEPECGVGSGLELFLCSDLECLDGPGSGSGPEVPMDGQVFEYLNRCWVLETSMQYYREDPPPGGTLLPANAVVVSESTLNCLDDCNAPGCARENVWFLATPCESCEPPEGTKIPAFCGADWADTVGADGQCYYFQYGGHCYYVSINSEPIDALDPLLHEEATVANTTGPLQSCCQCCETCMYTTARTPSSTDEPCAPEIDCCCGSLFNITIIYDLEVVDYTTAQCEDGSYLTYQSLTRRLTGTYKLSFDGDNATLQTNSLSMESTVRTFDYAGCTATAETPTTESVFKPGVTLNGCGVEPRGLWPGNIFGQVAAWADLRCSCESLIVYEDAIDIGGNNVGTVLRVPTEMSVCNPYTEGSALVSVQAPCFPGEAFSFTRVSSEVDSNLDCEGGTVTVDELIRGYSSASLPGGGCVGPVNVQSTIGTISWTITVEEDCNDGCSGGPGSGSYL